jgi:thiol:disulfide interchange protein DsbC
MLLELLQRRRRTATAFLTLATIMFFEPAIASAQSPASQARSDLVGQIRATQKIPGGGFAAVESEGTEGLTFLSDNGRYAIVGTLYDVWSGKRIGSISQLRGEAARIDFGRLGINMSDIGALTIGRGPKQAVIFVDPKCPYCHKVLGMAAALGDAYTFKIIVAPVLGKESENLTRMVSCAKDEGAAVAALTSGRTAQMQALEQSGSCDLAKIQKRLVTAQLLGVRGVPFLIGPAGITYEGAPSDLRAWLAGS